MLLSLLTLPTLHENTSGGIRSSPQTTTNSHATNALHQTPPPETAPQKTTTLEPNSCPLGHSLIVPLQAKTQMTPDNRLLSPRFPRASKYHPDWITASVSGGANPLWLTEWLTEDLELKPGMRVLDLGCGRAMSSIFLRREFNVEVWAADLWFSPTENLQRIRDAGVADGVFPLHAEARALPFAENFFDAIISVDSFIYYGTDDHYLNCLARFVKPGGPIGIAGAGMMQEINGPLPAHLREWWTPECWSLHSAAWWQRHWEKTGILKIETADTLEGGWKFWLDWHREIAPDNAVEIKALEADQGNYLGYVRLVGRRQGEVTLSESVTSIPAQYTRQPLLRSESTENGK